jgi:2-aminoadipate transaminase
MRGSMVREVLKLTTLPEVISFAGGLPGADLFPIDRFRDACRRVLDVHGAQALQYSTTEGERLLREMIARHNRPSSARFPHGRGLAPLSAQ